MAESAYRYPFAVRWLHWLGAVLVLVAYVTGESAEEAEQASGAVDWHVLAGLGLLLLFLPRLLAKFWIRKPAVLQSSAAEVWLARTIQLALLLFVLVEPLLGVFAVWAEGQPLSIPLTSWQLPALLNFGPGAGETLEGLHETVGNVFYAVIGLHVLAALWHHFRRRDGVLRRML